MYKDVLNDFKKEFMATILMNSEVDKMMMTITMELKMEGMMVLEIWLVTQGSQMCMNMEEDGRSLQKFIHILSYV